MFYILDRILELYRTNRVSVDLSKRRFTEHFENKGFFKMKKSTLNYIIMAIYNLS